MAYLPIRSSRGLVIYKNGQLYESGITLDFMLLTEQQSAKFSELLNTGTYLSTDVADIGFWADGHLPTNPIYTAANLSTGLAFAAGISTICSSPFLEQIIPNVGDEIMIKSMEYGSAYGIGFKCRALVGSTRRTYSFEWDDNGTRRTIYPGQQWTVGTVDNYGETEYWRFFFGIVMDPVAQKAYPFVVHGSYYLPYKEYDWIGVQAPLYSDAMYERLKSQTYHIFNDIPPEPVDDPYSQGGTSETQEPAGTFDDTSDTISVPSTPALNLALSHFMSAYAPGIAKINELADFIWGDYSGANRYIAKFFADPTDAIISLHMVPFTPSTSSDVEVTVGRYGTGVDMPPITTQFKDVDCGSLTVEPYWDNYLDYNPYTRLILALPFVGEVQLDPDEVMGETVNVLYRCDVLSGAFVCFVSTADKVLAQYTGNCSLSVPISSASYAQANAAIMQLAVSAVGLGTSAVGYSAALEAGTAKEIAKAGAQVTEASVSAGSSAMSVVNAKVNHSHSGSIAGTAGFLGIQKPYLLIHRARQSVPEKANKYHGYPCNVTLNLNNLVGFTTIKNIVLDDLPFTKAEIDRLRGILAAGIYI